MKKTVKLLDIEIEVEDTGTFLVPTSFADHESLLQWVPQLENLIHSGAPELQNTQWIIGSGAFDLNSNPRTSKSHQNGNAVDITPMWNDELVLDPSGSAPGLAWNMLSLAAISSITDRSLSFVVEGDHIHVSKHGKAKSLLPNSLIVATTASSCYPIVKKTESLAPVQTLMNKLYTFAIHKDGIMYQTLNPEDKTQFLDYIGHD